MFFFFSYGIWSPYSQYITLYEPDVSVTIHTIQYVCIIAYFLSAPQTKWVLFLSSTYIFTTGTTGHKLDHETHTAMWTQYYRRLEVMCQQPSRFLSVTLFNWLSVSGPSHTLATKKDDIQVNMKSNCTFLIHFTGVHDSSVYIYIKRKSVYLHNLLSKYNNFPFWLKII